jgi:two-component system, cell cycle response regulator DivK
MANSKKVLIAEDSSVVKNLTKKILNYENFEIVGVKNGKEAMDVIGKEDFSVILLDINMPEMDGMQCAKAIRALKDKSKANLPLIAITGNALNYKEEDFTNAGFNAKLQKPLNYDELVKLVKELSA